MKKLTILLCALSLGGCGLFTDRIAKTVAKGVERYCEEPRSDRTLIVDTINGRLAQNNHSVALTCAGDP